MNVIGLEVIGGNSDYGAKRPQYFTPAQFLLTTSKREGPLKWCSVAPVSATKEFIALIFWFVLDQAKMNILQV